MQTQFLNKLVIKTAQNQSKRKREGESVEKQRLIIERITI